MIDISLKGNYNLSLEALSTTKQIIFKFFIFQLNLDFDIKFTHLQIDENNRFLLNTYMDRFALSIQRVHLSIIYTLLYDLTMTNLTLCMNEYSAADFDDGDLFL